MVSKIFLGVLFIICVNDLNAASIILNTTNATVWLPEQTITGKISGIKTNKLKWHLNDTSGFVQIHQNGSFNFSIILRTKQNVIWVEDPSSANASSDTIHYTLGYTPLPDCMPLASINNDIATLDLQVLNNPYNLPLHFVWKTIKSPANVDIIHPSQQRATVKIPEVNGEYFFMITVYAGDDSVSYTTYVIKNNKSLHAFNIATEHSAWIDSAVIYEITPYVFVQNGKYDDITKKLSEIKSLGVNTIWLQPIYKTHYGEQGYDITDYFSLRPDFGTEKQLQNLITTAKNLKLRVMFDFVPNHTSIYHEYAKEVIQLGTQSHYYDFYQHANDGAEYSSQYTFDSLGFVHYFWDDLVNLNYGNPEVQQYILEAMKYWLRKFDIDGYRLDAMWALNARDTSFGKKLQTSLKSIKPDILLLAEDKAALHSVYKKGYDAAYDWTADTSWISSWSWLTNFSRTKDPTIFNYYDTLKRALLLDSSFFYNGDKENLHFRFLENNDLPRFIAWHGLERTKMAAALLFALPGIPMIYDGQEIGFQRKQYSNRAIFKTDQSIQSLDTNNLFPFYQQLTSLRLKYDALRNNNMEALPVQPATMYALHRWRINQHIIIAMNLNEDSSTAKINIRSLKAANCGSKFIDLLTNEVFYAGKNEDVLNILMKGYSTRFLLACDDTVPVAIDK